MFSLAYNLPKTMSNFCPSKLRRKKQLKTRCIFRPDKLHRKKYMESMKIPRTSKLHQKTYVETTWIFRPSKLHWKTVRGNNVDFSTTEITSKKVHGNNMDFSTSKITSKKVRENDIDFSISKVTSKKYAEITWKFVETWSSRYYVILTSNERGFDVVCLLGKHIQNPAIGHYSAIFRHIQKLVQRLHMQKYPSGHSDIATILEWNHPRYRYDFADIL